MILERRARADAWPVFSFITTNSQTYGALTFNRSKTASDAVCEVVAASNLSPPDWEPLTNTHATVDQGNTERVTVRDNSPSGSHPNRFYQLRVVLR